MVQSLDWGKQNKSHQKPQSRKGNTKTVSRRPTPFLLIALLLVLLMILVACALIWVYADRGGDYVQTARIVRQDESLKGFSIQAPLAHQYYPFNNEHVLRVTSDYVSYVDEDQNTAFSFRVDLSEPEVIVNGGYALIYDRDALNYYLFNGEGLHLYGQGSSAIQGAQVNRNGSFLLIMQDRSSRGILRVMDSSGRHRFDREFFDMENSGFLINAAFTPEGDAVDISMVNTDGMEADAVLLRISLEDYTTMWHYRIDEISSLPLLLHDSDGLLYSSDGTTIWQISEYGPALWHTIPDAQDMKPSEEGIWVLDDNGHTLYLLPWTSPGTALRSSMIETLELANSVKAWHPLGNRALIHQTDGQLKILSSYNTENVELLSVPVNGLLQIQWVEDKDLSIVTERQVLWLDLEE